MFNSTIVENSLDGIVGLHQPLDPDYAVLDAGRLASRSGLFVNGHDIPLAKVEFFKDAQNFEAITDIDFNTELERLQKSSITSVCNQVFTSEDFIDRGVFYKNANNNVTAETLTDGFVGFRIDVANKKNIAFEITRVLLDFTDTGSFDLLLFNTGDPNPIKTQTITITEQHQEVALNWVVDNTRDSYKGDYYLGYIKTGSTPIPFKREYQNARILSSISNINIREMQVPGHSTATLFDLDDEDGLSENIGVNPDILVYEDYTDFIIQNQRLFARAIQLEMGIAMMNASIGSLRSNRNTRISDGLVVQMIQNIEGVDAEGGKIKIHGLRSRLAGAIKQISVEIDKLRLGYLGGRIQVQTLT